MAFDHYPFNISWDLEEPGQEENAHEKFYSGFRLEGTTYGVGDTVYTQAPEGPPYIARILRLREDSYTQEKKMRVRWFCRPCELPVDLNGVNEDSKEIFVSWKVAAQSEVNLACTLKKCKVLCTWNRPTPSQDEIDACDHFFYRAFDLRDYKMRSLYEMVDKIDLSNVFGRGDLPDLSSDRDSSTGSVVGREGFVAAAVGQGSNETTAPISNGGSEYSADAFAPVGNGGSEYSADAFAEWSDPCLPSTPGQEASQNSPSGTERNGTTEWPASNWDDFDEFLREVIGSPKSQE